MTSGSCLSPAAICPSPAQAEKEGSRADKLPNLPIQIARLCLASDSGRHPVLGATPPPQPVSELAEFGGGLLCSDTQEGGGKLFSRQLSF